MKKFISFLLSVILILPSIAFGNSLQAGAVFLMIFPGSRATGMGGAFTASKGDIFSTYYNDGSLAFKNGIELGLQHANWLSGLWPGMYYEYLSLVYPLGKDLNLNFAVTYLTTGETEARKEDDTTYNRKWRTYDVAVKIGGSLRLLDKLGLGIGMKYIYSFLAPEDVVRELLGISGSGGSGQAWAVDLSLLYCLYDSFRLGIALQNLGPEITYIENGESDPLPRMLRLGTSFDILRGGFHKLNLNLDLIGILVGVRYTNFSEIVKDSWKAGGLEYTVKDLFSFRIGYFIDKVGKREGPTFGAGFNLNKRFLIDVSMDQYIYAFETSNYRISCQLSF
ncbi:MAG: PorV/PorQ family protein [candidate division WOR-3 bacterium]